MQDGIQLLISIDAEPEERLLPLDDPHPWWGLEELFANLGEMRQAFRDCTGQPAHFGWYWRLDPQIERVYGDAAWPLHRYASQIADLSQDGDECGVHPHAWRWDEERRTWIADHADQDWVAHCVEMSFAAFENFFKEPCRTFRFGESWINQATLDLVEALGAEFDLTVEPGRPPANLGMPSEVCTGEFPDLRDAPKLPYRCSPGDFRRPSDGEDGKLWIVPVSTGITMHGSEGVAHAVAADANAIEGSLRRNRMRWAIENAIRGSRIGSLVMRSDRVRATFDRVGRICLDVLTNSQRTRASTLNMDFPPHEYSAAFDQAVACSQSRYVHTVLRSGDLVRRESHDNFTKNLSFLINHPLAHRFKVSTPTRLVASWEKWPVIHRGT